MRTRILLSILLPLCSAAPLDIAHEDKMDTKAHDDRTHSREGSNTADHARVQKSISVSEIQMGDINLGSFAGDDMSISVGHQLEIGAHGHTGHAHAAHTHEYKGHGPDPHVHDTAVDGGWSNWSEYGQCSKICGGGQQTRTRTCTNPVPQRNGRTCEQQNIGDPTETKDCNLHDCEPIDCKLAGWSDWSACTVSCGSGTRTRLTNILVKETNGGKPCKTTEEEEECFTDKCPGDATKEEPKTGCGFDDTLVRTPKSTKPVANAHMFVNVETWYEWKDGKIPYYFKGSVIVGDKNLIKDVMNEIEQHTCFEFIPHKIEPLGHHLEIVVGSDSCVNGFSAYVKPKSNTKIILHSYFQFTDVGHCGNFRGGILHEMMHVFGIMHTHNRNDRDHYITVDQNNIIDMYKSQFEICTDCKTYREIPYECDSIMHYGYGICAKQSYGAKTMSAKDPSKCRLSKSGAQTPTKNDWKLLTIIGAQVCGAKKSGYVSHGCWRDQSDRAIAPLEGLDSRLEGNFEERINAVEICFEVAKSRGYPIFAVQAGGECFGSSTAMLTYKKYGPARNCGADGKGGNWANEVYNIQGSCEVHVGSNTNTKFKSATVSEGCECPEEVDKYNWLGGHGHPDKFQVTQNGQSVVVQRTDAPVGWGLDLAFMCVLKGSCEVYVGKSDSNIKRAIVEEGCECPEEVDIFNWAGGHWFPDKFAVTQNGKLLQVQRMDSNGGWGMDLVFKCKQSGNNIPSLKQLRIKIHKLKNVVNGVKKEQVEDLEKLSMDEKESLNKLNIATEHLKKYCRSENDDCTSKQILVSEKEIEQINESVNQDITGNGKIGKEFLINLKEKLEELDRAATEAQQSFKHQTGNSIIETIRILIPTIIELKKMVNGLGRDDKIEKSHNEIELLNIMDEVTKNLKNHCTNKNGFCKSEELVSRIKKLASTFEKIKETGKIGSGFLDNFEEFAENLDLAAENSHNFMKQGPTSFTECKSGTDCSCGSESCSEGQICTEAKCLNECEVKEGEILTEDCFCPDKEEGQLCEGGIDICTDLGCLDTSHHAFFFLFLG